MKYLLLIMIYLTTSCMSVEHIDGEMPTLECEECEKFCTADVDIDVRPDRVVLECHILI
jgi:hypothetical protein